MATLINDGWLYLSDGTDIMMLACREISYDIIRDPDINHDVGALSYGYDMGEKWIQIKVSGIILKTEANKNTFVDKYNSWLDSGLIYLKIQRNTGGAFDKLDGTNTRVEVLSPKGLLGIQKIAKENGVIYEIGKVVFEQSGSLSA